MQPIFISPDWLIYHQNDVALRLYDVSIHQNAEMIPQSAYLNPNLFKHQLNDMHYKTIFTEHGLHLDSSIILYDNGESETNVYKIYFVLCYFGFLKVSILQGGLHAWKTTFPQNLQTKYIKQVILQKPYMFSKSVEIINKQQLEQILQQKEQDINQTNASDIQIIDSSCQYQNAIHIKLQNLMIQNHYVTDPLALAQILRLKGVLKGKYLLVDGGLGERFIIFALLQLVDIKHFRVCVYWE
ncbi:3-mercaptopyruvate_sulfurtransferase / Thiosulfate sulfurtransferase [Hexamita inflata]|uniref:3-mercaptopyruvate sulfurtransferase / Thiosulfate sulfurtransferase n=1 Tax=Hexamita inflata TaxID=28002 RepID=A0AA86UEH2_9EUKA|nr:3-mercaptopyruvate sulfurtransferase / Thiosulfate sulfurtransferase [Hexamita inflata]